MRKIAVSAVFMAMAVCTFAQTLNSSYFLDHDNTRFRINPALMPDDDINATVGFLIGDLLFSPQSNIGLSSFLFPVDGQLVTGLNEKVPAEQFLGGLNENNLFNLGANLNFLTVGFRTDPDGFGTIELNTRSNTFTNMPKSLFSFLKLGSSQNTFDVRDYCVSTSNYMELALGYSRKIGDMFKVGGRAKFIGGLGRADIMVDKTQGYINTSEKQLEVVSEGSMAIYCPTLDIKTKTNADGTVVYDFSNITTTNPGIAGFGWALDLGVSCTPIEGLEISAAVQDLGKIYWKNSAYGEMAENTVVKISGTDLGEALGGILNFKPAETFGSTGISLPTTFRLGARYAMPFYNRLSFGILESLETGQYFKYNDIRVGATVTPVDQISVTVNYGITSYGSTMGLACNFSLGPVQLFVGTDAFVFEFTPQGVPVSKLNTTVKAGLMLQFRQKKSKA